MLVLSRLCFGGDAGEKRTGLQSKVEAHSRLSRLWARDLGSFTWLYWSLSSELLASAGKCGCFPVVEFVMRFYKNRYELLVLE